MPLPVLDAAGFASEEDEPDEDEDESDDDAEDDDEPDFAAGELLEEAPRLSLR